MRTFLEGWGPQVTAMHGTAEGIPLGDGSADAVFAADAFHWFDVARALGEIARVLGPGGGLVILWNHWWEVSPALPEEAVQLLREPYVRSGRAAAAAEETSWRYWFEESAFGELEEARYEREDELTARHLIALLMTTSSIAALPDEERTRLAGRLIDLLSGTYRLPVKTEVYWARRS
jgi:SAM-dependent methyltransferase